MAGPDRTAAASGRRRRRQWADAGGVLCAATDEDGHRLWDLDDLRAQVVTYLEDHDRSLQDIDNESHDAEDDR